MPIEEERMHDRSLAVATRPAVASPARSGGSSDGRWYASASFWTGPFRIGFALALALAIGVTWYTLGGFPRDHDKYGSVSVPGQQVLELPKGDVRINFENDTVGSGDNKSIQDQPRGLAVRVLPTAGGEPIAVKDVPSWLFSSTSGDRGHEPFGKVQIPSAGDYRIRVTDDQAGRFDSAAARRPAHETGSGPEIAFGQRPWSPLDSNLLGAILAGVLIFLAVLVPPRVAIRRLM
jgi:hypothetical protein